MYTSILILGICLTIALILFFCFSKSRSPLKLGIIFGVIHFFIVILLAVIIYFQSKRDPEAIMALLPLYVVDLPSTLLLFPLKFLVPISWENFILEQFYIPVIVFALFGSMQYFIIGRSIGRLFKKT